MLEETYVTNKKVTVYYLFASLIFTKSKYFKVPVSLLNYIFFEQFDKKCTLELFLRQVLFAYRVYLNFLMMPECIRCLLLDQCK